jgi:UDP-glucose 4-epimerase
MRILVTGGAGFIGTQLVNKLIEMKHEVVVLDNFSVGKRENVNSKAAIIEGDIKDPFDVAKAMKGCSAVFHLAAISDVRSSDDDTVYQTNFLASKHVFDAAAAKNMRIIFTSSAAVYGNAELPHGEKTQCKPISQYGKSKLLAERYLMQKSSSYFVVRLFNVYGPNGKSAINKFCRKMTNYQDVDVYGNGMQTRDYVYITDVVDALTFGLENTGLYNVGTGRDIAVTSLIGMIENITRCKPNIKNTPAAAGEIGRSRADITEIGKIGWMPQVALEDGVKMILDSVGWKKLI